MKKKTINTPMPWEIVVDSNACFHDTTRVSIFHVCVEDEPVDEDDDGTPIYAESTIAEVWSGSDNIDIKDGTLIAAAPVLLQACKCALADLEGIMPEFEPSGDRTHPAWETMKELKAAIKLATKWKKNIPKKESV